MDSAPPPPAGVDPARDPVTPLFMKPVARPEVTYTPPPPWLPQVGRGAVALFSTAAVVIALDAVGRAAWAVPLVGVMALAGFLGARRGARARAAEAPPRLPLDVDYGRPVRAVGAPETADRIAVDLAPASAGATPFDPADPRHRAMAEQILRWRERDGLGLVAEGPRGALIGSVLPLIDLIIPLSDRVAGWCDVARFLDARDDPRDAWLGAMACAEWRHPLRAVAALDGMGRGARARALAWLVDDGPWSARAAAAMHRGDAAAMDAVIAAGDDATPAQLAPVMVARWRAAPDPAAFEAWVRSPAHAEALATVELEPLDGAALRARWSALLDRDQRPLVATGASAALLEDDEAVARMGARAWLQLPGLLADALTDGLAPDHAALVDHCLVVLGRVGEAVDLRLLADWATAPRHRITADDRRDALRARLVSEVGQGGLSVVAVDEVGGVSLATDGAGGLSGVEPPPG